MTSMPLTSSRMEGAVLMLGSLFEAPHATLRKGASSRPAPPSRREGLGTEQPSQAAPETVKPSGLTVSRCAPRQLLLFGVPVGRGLYHRLDDLLVGLQPFRAEHPFRAVPGVHTDPVCAHVVGAAGRDRAHHSGKAEGVELLLVQRQVFQAPAGLFAAHDPALALS